jgi:hypothetical protein
MSAAEKLTWAVVVIFEDTFSRESGVKFCEHLMEKFWSRHEFDVSWWSYADVADARTGHKASERALDADLIIFATRPEQKLPASLTSWIESWLNLRGEREGVLVGLMDPGAHQCGGAADKYIYLRNVAHRAGMDYLTEIPTTMSRSVPDSLDSFSKRAEEVTGVLAAILRPPPPPRLAE